MFNELILWNLLRSLSLRRLKNLLLTGSSFLLSALTGRNYLWGKPSILTIEPTNICNLKCPLCTTGNGEMERPFGKMTLTTFINILDKMADDLFFLLLYHQGEPYINKHFLEFVKLAHHRKIYTTTSTNAHYFDDEIINATIDSGLDSMIVSLDGTSQDVYEKYRVNGQIDKVVDGLRRFMEIKKQRKSKTPLIALQFLVMKQNEHQLDAVKKLAKELQVDRLLIKNIEVRNLQEAQTWLPVDDHYRRYNFDGKTYQVKNNDKVSCPRPYLSTLINWDGSVVPCCFDKNGEHQMGNINVQPLDEIWSGQPFQTFRQQLNTDRKSIDMCRNCNMGLGSFAGNFRMNKKPGSFSPR